MEERKPDVMLLARKFGNLSAICKSFSALSSLTQSEAITIKYCGAMSDMIVDTLSNLHDKMYPVFGLAMANGILKEWGIKELSEADAEEIEAL